MVPPIAGGEIYMIDHLVDGSFSVPRRLTANLDADIFRISPEAREDRLRQQPVRALGEP